MRQATSILQVVVLQITHLSGVVILQQAQRTVEAQHLAAQVERRKPNDQYEERNVYLATIAAIEWFCAE